MNTSTGIRGSYGTGGNYLNDYWFEDTPPRIELGFGGGYVILEPHGSDSLQFQVEVVCGPTYHFAMAEGMAVKQGDVYVWNNGEGCEIRITPGERSVQLKASASLECGFGARAYLDHDFVKISDQCVFGPDVSLHSIKQAEDKR